MGINFSGDLSALLGASAHPSFDPGALKGDLSSSTPGSGLSGIKNTLEGDPASAVAGLTALQKQAYDQGTAIKNFLMGQKGASMAYYKPMQQMFGSMYGTKGIAPARAPGMPGSTPLAPGGGGGGGTY